MTTHRDPEEFEPLHESRLLSLCPARGVVSEGFLNFSNLCNCTSILTSAGVPSSVGVPHAVIDTLPLCSREPSERRKTPLTYIPLIDERRPRDPFSGYRRLGWHRVRTLSDGKSLRDA